MTWTAESIREYRKSLGWSRKYLANRMQYGMSAIAHWEQGIRQPTRRSIQVLEAAFGLRPEWEAKLPPICPTCNVARTCWQKRDCGACRGKRYRAKKGAQDG